VGIAHGPSTRAYLDSASVGVGQGRPRFRWPGAEHDRHRTDRTAPASWPGLADWAVAGDLPAPRCTPKRGL